MQKQLPNGDNVDAVCLVDPKTGASVTKSMIAIAVAAATANNTNLFEYDAQTDGYGIAALSVQLIAPVAWTGVTVSFQSSNDGVTYVAAQAVPAAGGAKVTSTTAVGHWIIPVVARYTRVRTTAYVSGTVSGVVLGMTQVPDFTGAGTQAVSGTVTVASTTANEGTWANPTASNINSAASTNATSIKATAGTLFSIVASNTGGAVAYVKLYNKASAPTVGTDVPVLTIPVPAGAVLPIAFGRAGHRFATGIALAITNGAADSDTAAVAAAQVKVLSSYS